MRLTAALIFLLAVCCATARSANALPVFAHRYGLSCQACHTTVPHLNAFGEAFRNGGYRLPNPRGAFPVAVKVNLEYASDPDESGLPNAVVDEIELLSGGALGPKASYFVEQYVVDGGRPGLTRDAWIQFNASDSIRIKAGQVELPLPVEIESDRPTLTHYALYDQTVGEGTFDFFDPRIGVDASFENDASGLRAHVLALHAYDRQTAAPRSGIDLVATFEKTFGSVTLSTYRYQGQRNLATQNRFWRQGYAASIEDERVSLIGVLQSGNDTNADGDGEAARSSGGFLEAQYHFNDAFTAAARYEGTSDSFAGAQRRLVFSTIMRPRKNMRFTLEDAITQRHHVFGAALLFAY